MSSGEAPVAALPDQRPVLRPSTTVLKPPIRGVRMYSLESGPLGEMHAHTQHIRMVYYRSLRTSSSNPLQLHPRCVGRRQLDLKLTEPVEQSLLLI